MAGRSKLVIGASGFLGSHVTRQLVERGDEVRVLLRRTSSTKAIDDLKVERHYGDVFDDDALRTAMHGVSDVFYCVVDTRAWLRDPAPLFRTNVEGLQHVLDAALDADLHRFVFTSSIGTIGIPSEDRPATEDDEFNWAERGGGYIRSRVAAENLVLEYARERGLPAVALCVANTYGPGDYAPTPHGALLSAASAGKMPAYVKDTASEVVGIEDAAAALLLAADKGRIGERYIISERFMTAEELYAAAARGRWLATASLRNSAARDVRAGLRRRRGGHAAAARLRPVHTQRAADARHVPDGSRQGRTRTRLATGAGARGDQQGDALVPRPPAPAAAE